jgi:hypothetical protein
VAENGNISGVHNAELLDIHFTFGTSCERAAPLAEKNAAARHHVLGSLISLHTDHMITVNMTDIKINGEGP